MKSFTDCGIVFGEVPATYNTDDAVELAVATYQDLGFIADASKAQETFGQEIADLTAKLPESLADQPYDMVIVPRLGLLTMGDLVERYDELTSQKGNPRTNIWEPLWDKYSDKELNQGQTEAIEAKAVLLGGENDYDEPGLYFTGQTLKEQRKSLKEAQKTHEGDASELDSLSVAGYMIRNAMQLERGEQLMDRPTYTRFIGLDSKRVDGGSYVPDAGSGGDGRVYLSRSRGLADPRDGVRLAVGLK